MARGAGLDCQHVERSRPRWARPCQPSDHGLAARDRATRRWARPCQPSGDANLPGSPRGLKPAARLARPCHPDARANKFAHGTLRIRHRFRDTAKRGGGACFFRLAWVMLCLLAVGRRRRSGVAGGVGRARRCEAVWEGQPDRLLKMGTGTSGDVILRVRNGVRPGASPLFQRTASAAPTLKVVVGVVGVPESAVP